MSKPLSRRDFLALGGLALGSLALQRLEWLLARHDAPSTFPTPDNDYQYPSGVVGRITRDISVFPQPKWPTTSGDEIGYLHKDDLVNIYYELTPSVGPAYNPVWYRVFGGPIRYKGQPLPGYIHSAYVQRVKYRFNVPASELPRPYNIGEITVPYTRAYKKDPYYGWQPLADIDLLYYLSTHWVVGVDEGPDSTPWYRLHDELRKDEYHIPAVHLRLIPDEELTPISPDVPPEDKRIEIILQNQILTAYEGDQVVFQTRISSGLDYRPANGIPWNTPPGRYPIQSKYPSKHMGDGNLAEDYDLPGVPWTIFFLSPPGYALHGTYWHNNFGVPMSHGCVNLRTEEAKWLFRWTTPAFKLDGENGRWLYTTGHGTMVNII